MADAAAPAGAPVKRRLVVLYDPTCAFCVAAVRVVQRLDWRGCIDALGAPEGYVLDDGRALSRALLDQAVHVVTPEDEVLRGFFACRRVAAVLPLLWPLLPLLYLPGAAAAGTAAYMWVARHRPLLARWFRVSY